MKKSPFYCKEKQEGSESASLTTQHIQIHLEMTVPTLGTYALLGSKRSCLGAGQLRTRQG